MERSARSHTREKVNSWTSESCSRAEKCEKNEHEESVRRARVCGNWQIRAAARVERDGTECAQFVKYSRKKVELGRNINLERNTRLPVTFERLWRQLRERSLFIFCSCEISEQKEREGAIACRPPELTCAEPEL